MDASAAARYHAARAVAPCLRYAAGKNHVFCRRSSPMSAGNAAAFQPDELEQLDVSTLSGCDLTCGEQRLVALHVVASVALGIVERRVRALHTYRRDVPGVNPRVTYADGDAPDL